MKNVILIERLLSLFLFSRIPHLSFPDCLCAVRIRFLKGRNEMGSSSSSSAFSLCRKNRQVADRRNRAVCLTHKV